MPSFPASPAPVLSTAPRPAHGARRLAALASTLLLSLALAGCAAQLAFREGRQLVEKNQIEAGLSKLQEAVRLEPHGVEYKSTYLQTRDRICNDYLVEADRLLAAGKPAEADKLYRRVLGIDATNERAAAGLQAVQADARHAQLILEGEQALERRAPDTASQNLRTVLGENPNHPGALALRRKLSGIKAPASPEANLAAAFKKPITIEFKDVALKQIMEIIARTSGLNIIFDKDVKTDQKTSIFLKNSTIEAALHVVMVTNQLERMVLDANTIMIYPNSPQKLKDYQEILVKTFFISNADAKIVGNTIKTIAKTRDVVVDEKLNMIIVRDSPEAIRMIEKLVALQDVPEPEVMLEVEILEIKHKKLLNLGIAFPSKLTLSTPLKSGDSMTLANLRNLASSGVSASGLSVTANAESKDTDTNLLANPRIRARNREKAKIVIGDKVPVITTTNNGFSSFTSESISYLDVGLTLEVEPTVYLDNDVAIKVNLVVSNVVSQEKTAGGSTAYQIGNRSASTVLRLKDGETQVLAGLINDEERQSFLKIPGLGDFPILGRMFGNTNREHEKSELVLAITPRLIRNIQRPEASAAEFRIGTESSLRTRPDSIGGQTFPLQPTAPLPLAPPIRPGALGTPTGPTPSPTGAKPGEGATSQLGSPMGGGTPAVFNGQQANPGATGGMVPTPPKISLQGPQTAQVGTEFSVQVVMVSDIPLTTVQAALGYDSKTLEVTDITLGDFFRQGGGDAKLTKNIAQNTGQATFTAQRPPTSGATGFSSIATVRLKALAPSDSTRLALQIVGGLGVGNQPLSIATPSPMSLQIQP